MLVVGYNLYNAISSKTRHQRGMAYWLIISYLYSVLVLHHALFCVGLICFVSLAVPTLVSFLLCESLHVHRGKHISQRTE